MKNQVYRDVKRLQYLDDEASFLINRLSEFLNTESEKNANIRDFFDLMHRFTSVKRQMTVLKSKITNLETKITNREAKFD